MKLLLVDDDINTYNLMKPILEGSEYQLDWAKNPEECFRLNEAETYDTFIFDYNLGKPNGIELHNILKVNKPAILLTDSDNDEVTTEAMRAGFDDFIRKQDLSADYVLWTISKAEIRCDLERQLNQSKEDLQKLYDNLQRKNAQIQSFYHSLSHELKTPLHSLKEFTSIMLDGLAGEINEEQREHLSNMMESCSLIELYINDLLDVVRIETNKLRIEPEQYPAQELAEFAMSQLMQTALKDGIKIEYDNTLNKTVMVYADMKRTAQALSNLITNAIKFAPSSSEVKLTVKESEDGIFVEYIVEDEGIGISEEDLPYIFDRLYQSEYSSKKSRHGLGLGLSIAKDIVEMQGGMISVQSVLGEGSAFTVSLPRIEITEGGKNV